MFCVFLVVLIFFCFLNFSEFVLEWFLILSVFCQKKFYETVFQCTQPITRPNTSPKGGVGRPPEGSWDELPPKGGEGQPLTGKGGGGEPPAEGEEGANAPCHFLRQENEFEIRQVD